MKTAAALAFVTLHYWIYAFLGTNEVIPDRVPFVAFPREVPGWACPRMQPLDADAEAILGVTDYVLCDWVGADHGAPVNLYVGYHESQARRYGPEGDEVRTIHPPEHCLPGGGWSIVDSRIVPVRSGGLDGEAKRFVIARGDARQVVYFWYQSRGRIIARNHEVILYKFLDRAARGRSDGALVRFTAPIRRDDVHSADAAIRDFAAAITPHLGPHLPD